MVKKPKEKKKIRQFQDYIECSLLEARIGGRRGCWEKSNLRGGGRQEKCTQKGAEKSECFSKVAHARLSTPVLFQELNISGIK